MHRQAWIAWLLILLQAGMFWYFSDTIVFPVFVMAISLPAAWWRRRWELSSVTLPWIDLGIAGLCAMKWYLAPYDPPTVSSFVMYPEMHAAAQFFLLVQVARLWARRPDRPLPVYLPLLAVLVFICLGDVQLSRYGRMRRMYQNGTLALAGLSCLYYSQARRRQEALAKQSRWVRPTLSVGVFLVCAVAARAGNSWVLSSWSELEELLQRASGARARTERQSLFVGFSGQAPLGSVQLLRTKVSNEIALRVFSEQSPGYLRGAVFERLTQQGWDWQSRWAPLIHVRKPLPVSEWLSQPPPASTSPQPQFLLRPHSSSELTPMTIWRAPSVERFSFLPLSASRVAVPSQTLFVDRHGVVSTDNLPVGASVVAWVPQEAAANSQEPIIQSSNWQFGQSPELSRSDTVTAQVQLRQLPERLDPEVEQLAIHLFTGCPTPRDKIQAVRRYFASYRYGLSVQVPPGVDPVSYFLLEKPAAHCEFFASGTAVLLRLAGIPCRYVTGYAGADYNRIGRYWVVRQRDAHAWVEAYVRGEGWIVVDSTPEGFSPATTESFGVWQFWDDLNLRGQAIRTALADETWSGKFFAVKLLAMALLTTVPGWMLIGGFLFLLLRKLPFARQAAADVVFDPALIELRRRLQELDRRLRRWNLERAAHETLHQFAERLRAAAQANPRLSEAAAWYQHYAAVRYGLLPGSDDRETLRRELHAVCERLPTRG